jgi:hypothetical protein
MTPSASTLRDVPWILPPSTAEYNYPKVLKWLLAPARVRKPPIPPETNVRGKAGRFGMHLPTVRKDRHLNSKFLQGI